MTSITSEVPPTRRDVPRSTVRVAAVGDLHCDRRAKGVFAPLFATMSERSDMIVLCGDLTDYGQPEEAHILARELGHVKVPVLAVLGNHDHESDHAEEIEGILADAGVIVLDGEATEVAGVGVAGVKGFCGGFGRRTLEPWGETAIKSFVQEAIREAIKLEKALARLRTSARIALLHYAPIQATVEGEPEAIFPFLGSSRLAEPLTRYPVSAVFHGHAHRGSLEGRIGPDAPVYNVAMPLLRRSHPDRAPYRLVELSVAEPEG